MKRMSAKTLSLLISAVLLFSVVIIPQSIAAPQLEKVNFLLNWKITGDHSPYYVALKKGWYADVGLDVNVIVGQGSGYSVQAVDSGKADIAISDAPVPISSREK